MPLTNPNNTTINQNPGNQGTIQATFTYPEFSNLIKKTFLPMLENVKKDAEPFYINKPVPMGQGDSFQVNEMDFTTYASNMPEGVDAQKGQTGVGYHKQVLWHRYGLEYDITYKQRTTAQWVDIVKVTVEALSQAVPMRQNLDMTHQITTFGNATSYTDQDGFTRDTATGDGLSLFNSAHLLAFSPNTYSNIVPGNPAFNKSSLESAELLTKTDIRDNFGKKKRMNFDTIWSGDDPTTCNDIKQLLRSTADPSQANSEVSNPYNMGSTKYDHIELSMLSSDANGDYDDTKRRWWGIAALSGQGASRLQAYHCVWESPRLKTMPQGKQEDDGNSEDVHNDNWTFGARGASNQAVVSGRGIIASLPTS